MKQTITVEGMRCEHCEARVEQTLAKMAGISGVKADRSRNTVEVDYDPAAISAADIVESIEDCGYRASL